MEYIIAVLGFLQDYNGALIAIFTFCLVLVTIQYVRVTGWLVQENRLLRKAGTEPELVAYLLPAERYPIVMNFVLANVGQGPAKHVTVTLEADIDDFTRHKVEIGSMKVLERLSILPQGEKLVTFFGVGPDLLGEPKMKPFGVRVGYEDLGGNRKEASYELDVRQFENITTVGHPADHDIAEALKKIADILGRWKKA